MGRLLRGYFRICSNNCIYLNYFIKTCCPPYSHLSQLFLFLFLFLFLYYLHSPFSRLPWLVSPSPDPVLCHFSPPLVPTWFLAGAVAQESAMSLINRKRGDPSLDSSSPPRLGSGEKGPPNYNNDGTPGHVDNMRDPTTRLQRGLKARQVTMIAIGGAIGTGLIIGTGSALAKAGPLSILISYSIVGFIVYMVMCALGEMATWLPLESGFTGYASRFCDPALGFSLGYTYWFKYIIVTPNQLTAGALVIQYWVDREKVNPGVFIAVFLVAIVLINYLGIRFFGEFEFWLSSIKVLTICGLILLSLILMLGGGPDHDRKGFRYWKNPGAMKPLYKSKRCSVT